MSWSAPTLPLALPDDEVHVWRAALDLNAKDFETLRETLAPDERARAARFHFERDRNRYTAARGILREILARYLGREPAELQFRYSPSGKPSLATDELRFNLSHSHGLALYAIARNREVGIDVEYVRPELAEERIPERFFSNREVTALRSLPPDRQAEAFFNCWTRKEAYIKARGGGLAIALNSFDVSLAPGEPAAILDVRGEPAEVSRWSLEALSAGPGYVAAVAAQGQGWQIRLWERRSPLK